MSIDPFEHAHHVIGASCHYCDLLRTCLVRNKDNRTVEECNYKPVSVKHFLERQRIMTDIQKNIREAHEQKLNDKEGE